LTTKGTFLWNLDDIGLVVYEGMSLKVKVYGQPEARWKSDHKSSQCHFVTGELIIGGNTLSYNILFNYSHLLSSISGSVILVLVICVWTPLLPSQVGPFKIFSLINLNRSLKGHISYDSSADYICFFVFFCINNFKTLIKNIKHHIFFLISIQCFYIILCNINPNNKKVMYSKVLLRTSYFL
jgi:hypothetical protein